MKGKKDAKIPFALAFGAENRPRKKYLVGPVRLKTKNPRR